MSQIVWIEMQRPRRVGYDGDFSLGFPRDRSPAPMAHTIPQASVETPHRLGGAEPS